MLNLYNLFNLIIIILVLYIFFFKKYENFSGNISTVETNLDNLKNSFSTNLTTQKYNSYYKTTTPKLSVSGTLNVNFLNILPDGVIFGWESNTIPKGWVLCDGSNGTPDLRGKFIIGAGTNSQIDSENRNISNYAYGTTGGSATHVITMEEMAVHNHGYTRYLTGGPDEIDKDNNVTYQENTFNTGNMYNEGGNNRGTGATQAHENMPPYRTINWIMRKRT